jgi:hypothetical protein
MTERAKKERQDWTSDILWVVLYVINCHYSLASCSRNFLSAFSPASLAVNGDLNPSS